MKSRLFSKFDLDDEKNKAFFKDLKQFVSTTDAQKKAFIKKFPKYLIAKTESEKKEINKELEKDTKLNPLALDSVKNISRFLIKVMAMDDLKNDSIDDWVADMTKLKLLNKANAKSFKNFVIQIQKNAFKKIKEAADIQLSETGVLPSFLGCGTTVELRALIEKPFEMGEPIDSYVPKINNVIPVASVSINLNKGLIQNVTFQLALDELELFVDKLNATLKDAKALEKSVSLNI